MRPPEVASWFVAASAAVFVTLANNRTLIVTLVDRIDLHTAIGLWTAFAIPFLVTAIAFILLLTIGAGRLLKPLVVTYLLVASIVGFFVDRYGVIFDEDMIRNVVDTVAERNVHEATELISVPLLTHAVLFGLFPAILVALIPIRRQSTIREFKVRLAAVAVAFALSAFTLLVDSRGLFTFGAENRDMRHFITPLYAVASAEKYFRHEFARDAGVFRDRGRDAHIRNRHVQKTLGVLIVGETARADHFSLNGYTRTTNPLLAHDNVISFKKAYSCGTATAVSVPCIFSLRNRAEFDVDSIRHESNVLDVLHNAVIDVVWLDGNSGCKGVCARIDYEGVNAAPGESNEEESGYFDTMLVDSMIDHIDKLQHDSLIVLHMLGSHGPAYGKRVPAEFQVFQPACAGNSPISCDRSQLINAYDNTIVYTDYVIHRVIEELSKRSGELDTFVLYVSDHGESLGEDGIFLHGLPYPIAPDEQKHVAMIFWGSSGFAAHHGLTADLLSGVAKRRLSHDNISHALLGLLDVMSEEYDPRMDPFAGHGPKG